MPEHPLPETPPASQDELNKLIEKYAKQYQLDAAVLRKGSERNAFRAAKLAEELAQRVAEHIPAVAKAVGSPPRKDTEACRVREAASQLTSAARPLVGATTGKRHVA